MRLTTPEAIVLLMISTPPERRVAAGVLAFEIHERAIRTLLERELLRLGPPLTEAAYRAGRPCGGDLTNDHGDGTLSLVEITGSGEREAAWLRLNGSATLLEVLEGSALRLDGPT